LGYLPPNKPSIFSRFELNPSLIRLPHSFYYILALAGGSLTSFGVSENRMKPKITPKKTKITQKKLDLPIFGLETITSSVLLSRVWRKQNVHFNGQQRFS
jgi:hypothetical protein